MPSVRCGDIDIYYEDRGAGPAIVWIPGTGLRGSTWELQVRRFCDRFRCLTVDLRGSGNSGGADSTFSVADLASASGPRSRRSWRWPARTWRRAWSCWLPGRQPRASTT
jgi:pimeloyl-ACP methyl ester carboxylesterase